MAKELAPYVDHHDLIIHRSDRSGFKDAEIVVYDLPPFGRFDFDREARDSAHPFGAYSFGYRPRAEKGITRLTFPSLGMEDCVVSRNHVLLIPPQLRLKGEWANAAGKTARFVFSPPLIQAVASKIGLQTGMLSSLVSFHIDQRLECLCRLLMEETENDCRQGQLYFQSLAQAIAASMLIQVRNRENVKHQDVPEGIRKAIQRLEDNFEEALSVSELADRAHLSRYHFARTFRRFTGYTPHEYLLRVRLSRARTLMTQNEQEKSMAEIAIACGFFDQAHFNRHFHRAFGITPTAFIRQQEHPRG